jgi:hypothetical protein
MMLRGEVVSAQVQALICAATLVQHRHWLIVEPIAGWARRR